jgi:hypothetical protein
MKAEKRLERSGVVDSSNGGSVVSSIRTSDGMFFERAEDAILECRFLQRPDGRRVGRTLRTVLPSAPAAAV